MNELVNIAKALSDDSRVRVISALRQGELCVCQIVVLLELAPSTVSRHMSVLFDAGLVERRREGKWLYYRLARQSGPTPTASALRWVTSSLKDCASHRDHLDAVCCIQEQPRELAAACYAS